MHEYLRGVSALRTSTSRSVHHAPSTTLTDGAKVIGVAEVELWLQWLLRFASVPSTRDFGKMGSRLDEPRYDDGTERLDPRRQIAREIARTFG